MNKATILVIDAIVVIAFLVVAVVYWTHPANQLPHWYPGYSASDSATHIKHGLAALIVAAAAAALGWFATGPKSASDHSGSANQQD